LNSGPGLLNVCGRQKCQKRPRNGAFKEQKRQIDVKVSISRSLLTERDLEMELLKSKRDRLIVAYLGRHLKLVQVAQKKLQHLHIRNTLGTH